MQRRPKREETLVGIVGSISLNFHGVLIVCRLFHSPNVTTDLSPFLSLALSDNSKGSNGSNTNILKNKKRKGKDTTGPGPA